MADIEKHNEVILAEARAIDSDEGERLDRFVAGRFPPFPTKSSARKAIEREEVRLNGHAAKPNHRMRPGDLVEQIESMGPLPAPFNLDLPVHLEDDVLAVVEKPPGIPVVGNQHRTLLHALPQNLSSSTLPDALRMPRPVHRLDWPTGGLVVVAKTASALAKLSKSFEERLVKKEYRAIVMGRLPAVGEVNEPVDGRSARTTYEVLSSSRSLRSDWLSLVRLQPESGRKHQLRRHMLSLGCPILGDVTYGEYGHILRGKGLFLWATGVRFPHPVSGAPVDVEVPLPTKFHTVLEREQRRWNKFRDPS